MSEAIRPTTTAFDHWNFARTKTIRETVFAKWTSNWKKVSRFGTSEHLPNEARSKKEQDDGKDIVLNKKKKEKNRKPIRNLICRDFANLKINLFDH